MPDLNHSLQGRDLGHFRAVASLWGLEFSAPDTRIGLRRLVPAMLDRKAVENVYAALPPEARAALDDLMLNEARLPWALFTRRYGAIREMGPGRRDRDLPHQKPVSAAEMLWYRALVARSFFDTPTGPEEYAYIPEDLLALIPQPQGLLDLALGRPATPAERAYISPAVHHILDHACTLLAALRLELSEEALALAAEGWKPPAGLNPNSLRALLFTAGLLENSGMPIPEPVRAFLEAGRAEALALLVRAWLNSTSFNELRLIPHLRAEGEWENDPLIARRAVLDFLARIPDGKWWSVSGFVTDIKQKHPDFQRPAGDYDSWFLRDLRQAGTDDFLRGFEHWDEVDGELVRFFIQGPLHWLGLLDLAHPAESGPVTAFRLSKWALALLKGEAPAGLPLEKESLALGSDGKVIAPRSAQRSVRYQLARFCAWEGEQPEAYRYKITPASLARARAQGLTAGQLLSLLRRSSTAVPPSLSKALERWEQNGPEVRLERLVVLRLTTPDLLAAVRASRAARFLGDPLGPTAVIVKAGAVDKVLAVLAEMGYLAEAHIE
jgi:hypothetical protein